MEPLAYARLIAVPALLTVVLTVLVSPVAIALYRRRLGHWMRESGTPGFLAGDTDTTVIPRPSGAIVLEELGSARGPGRDPESTFERASRRRIRRTAIAYGVAGAAHAGVLTLAFAAKHQAVMSATALFAALAVFGVPAVVTVLHVLLAAGRRQFAAVVAILFAALVFAGDARGLAVVAFQLHILVPAALFVLFSFRYWRGVAPLTLLWLAGGSVGWVLAAEVGRTVVAEGGLLWLVRLAGFGAGLWAGVRLLRALADWHARGGCGDQEIFLDTWWLTYSLIQVVIFTLSGTATWLVLPAFPVYWVLKRALLGGQAPAPKAAPRLLLLRVFGHDRRTERFFNALSQRWRAAGPIELIAGRDLALRQVDPLDFIAFLTGSLGARFVKRPPVAAQLADPNSRPDPDGRYRVRQFLCHADTWRPVMRSLAAGCDAVVMDLRGFTQDKEGCRFELQVLAGLARHAPVVLVTDRATDTALVRDLVGASTAGEAAAASRWAVVKSGASGDVDRTVFRLLGNRIGPAAALAA